MAKINKRNIYNLDGTYDREDSWVGSDANNVFNTRTYTVGGLLDYIMLNYGGTEQNNILIRSHYNTTVVPSDIVADINTRGLTILANEIALVTNFVTPASGGSYLAMYIINTGKGIYNESNPLTWNSLTALAPMFVTTDLQTAEGETIDLGDIGSSTIEDHINALVGVNYDLLENVIYFFTTIEVDVPKTYVWLGDTPLTIGEGGTAVTSSDFDLIAVNGSNVNSSIITKTSELINDGEDGINPFLTTIDVVEPVSEQLDVSVDYLSGLTFHVTANKFPVNGKWYSATEGDVTLDASDVTFDRIDVFIADINGTVGKITGTASANPEYPNYDTSTQYPIKFILIKVGATTPDGYTKETIFAENTGEPTEWTFSSSGGAIAVTATTPDTGTVSVEASYPEYNIAYFTNDVPATSSDVSLLKFRFFLKSVFVSSNILVYFFKFNGSTYDLQYTHPIKTNKHGFLAFSTYIWQTIAIDFSTINVPTFSFDRIGIMAQRDGHIGWFLDNFEIQYNTTQLPNGNIFVPKKTSQLINDGEDGVNPFITALDVVDYSEWATYTGTRAGNNLITTIGDYDDSSSGTKIEINDNSGIITLNALSGVTTGFNKLSGGIISSLGSAGGNQGSLTMFTNGGTSALTASNALSIFPYSVASIGFRTQYTGVDKQIRFDYNIVTAVRTYSFPNTSGTVALTSDIVTPTLQVVATAGNITTLNIGALSFNDLKLFAQVGIDADNIGIGEQALVSNSAVSCIGIGSFAMNGNNGGNTVGVGQNAGQINSGSYCIAIGYYALQNNLGSNSVGVGRTALLNNKGEQANGVGRDSLAYNTGNDSNGIGNKALYYNNSNNAVGVGNEAMQFNNGLNNTSLGYRAYNIFNDDVANLKNVANAATDVDIALGRITITAHGFGATNAYVNLRYTSTGTNIGGIVSGVVYQFQIIDANTLKVIPVNIFSTGTDTHTFTPQFTYSNVTVLGANAEPTKSNQVVLGDSSVTEVKTAGTFVSGGYTVGTLPTGVTGARAYVTDATATTFYSIVTGGGANVVPVFYNGTNWVIA